LRQKIWKGPSERRNFYFEKGHIGYKKIENFMLVSKKQTSPNDKMPAKKVRIKKPFPNFAKSHFFVFLFNFFGGILSQRQVCFFEITIKFSIFCYPI
jgi:hypothetical protein